jgi:hypothetical protein
MIRRNFIALAGANMVVAGGVYYLKANKNNFIRVDINANSSGNLPIKVDEQVLLSLAARAPSGHNAQFIFLK